MRINSALRQLDEITYPVAVEDVVLRLNDPELELASGTQRLSEIFGSVDVQSVTSPDDAKLVMLSGLATEAIGRKGYSDRDPPTTRERTVELWTF